MSIFIDSSVLSEIQKYHKLGIIRGVTTNPSIMLKDGVKGGMAGVKARSTEIADLVSPLPVSVEVLSNDKYEMLDQAREFSSWAPNINVKITVHGPNGELENLEVVHQLEENDDVRVNVTAMMNAQQCYLAAMAGASYVSIFGGRVNNMGYDSNKEISRLRRLLDKFSLKAKIIVGSVREILNIVEWLDAGAHIITTPPKLIEGAIVHPYTKETVQTFLNDAAKINNN
jgi:transaldolase